jgi:selenocysteine lyase/cysteine desulfurase
MEDCMLPSQRALFDIPEHVCYLNAAAVGPLPRAVKAAGEIGVARKAQPWAIEPGNAQRQFERARTAAARLINADPDDVALISSVSYGIATAGKVLTVPIGSRVLLLRDDHSSPVLEWLGRANPQGFESFTPSA